MGHLPKRYPLSWLLKGSRGPSVSASTGSPPKQGQRVFKGEYGSGLGMKSRLSPCRSRSDITWSYLLWLTWQWKRQKCLFIMLLPCNSFSCFCAEWIFFLPNTSLKPMKYLLLKVQCYMQQLKDLIMEQQNTYSRLRNKELYLLGVGHRYIATLCLRFFKCFFYYIFLTFISNCQHT